jgi:uncharacterized protein YodC (DUF2158 family)
VSWFNKTELAMGDSVTLTAGGVAMTIVEFREGSALCVWHDKTGRDRERSFPLSCLVHHNVDADFNLIIEGFNATSEEIAELRSNGSVGNA